MLFISVTGEDGRTFRYEFLKNEVTIGRVQGNDLVLPVAAVSLRHTRLVVKDDRCFIVDLKSTNGTFVNGQRIDSPLVLRKSDRVDIGAFTLEVSLEDEEEADTGEFDATELRLLAAVARRDEGSRLVYADWLEEHGDPDRAEFLRINDGLIGMSPDSPEFRVRSDRMRSLARTIDPRLPRWRFKVARPVVLNCLAVEFTCPKVWSDLATTERADVRFCGACARRVYYCRSVREAQQYARSGECVALDVGNQAGGNDQVMGGMAAP